MEFPVSKINEYFDHVYVLNLKRRTDRKVAMLQKLSRLGIVAEFINAADGYTLQNKIEHQNYIEKPIGIEGSHPIEIAQQRKLIASPGAWGYLKTYIGILNDAKKSGYGRILCFDDDVLFHKDFENRFQHAINKIPQDWKLFYLGATQHVWRIPGGLSYPNTNKNAFDENEPFYFPKSTDGSFAVGIDSSVYDLLLEEVLKMNCPFDSGPLRAVIARYPKKCLVLSPNIVIADVSESDIQGQRNQHQLSEKLKWDLINFDFPFQLDLVSVIVPLYNAEKTIGKAIRSILMQSYSGLEVIVVDDASTDNSVEVVKNIMLADTRVKLVAVDKNIGVGCVRNEGLRNAKGKLIAFQDSDDVSLKNRIEKQLVPIYEKRVLFSVSLIYRSQCTFEELDISDQEAMISLVESRRVPQVDGSYDYWNSANVGLATTIFKRSVFEEFGIFDNHRIGSDLEFVERIFYFTLNKEFNEKYNGHSLMNYGESISRIFYRLDEVQYICPYLNENNLTSQAGKKKEEQTLNRQKFRNKYISGGSDIFPKLSSKTSFSPINYNTLDVSSFMNFSTESKNKKIIISL